MSKEHGIHNEQACDFLLGNGQFSDWVITTAFYSALHYVEHELMPIDDGGVTYTEFSVYFDAVIKVHNPRTTKHWAMIELVDLNLPACSPYYRWLFHSCHNARYKQYKLKQKHATKAKESLKNIKALLKK